MKHGKWMWIGIALVVGLLIMGAMKYKSGCGQGKRIPNVSFDPLMNPPNPSENPEYFRTL